MILLVLCATMSLQGASLTPHDHTQDSDHCCGVCHAGHLAMLHPGDSLACAASNSVQWFTPSSVPTEMPEPLLAAGVFGADRAGVLRRT